MLSVGNGKIERKALLCNGLRYYSSKTRKKLDRSQNQIEAMARTYIEKLFVYL